MAEIRVIMTFTTTHNGQYSTTRPINKHTATNRGTHLEHAIGTSNGFTWLAKSTLEKHTSWDNKMNFNLCINMIGFC